MRFRCVRNEAVAHTFARTPSFAWNPVTGAKSYEFELSTSRRFSDNGIVWSGKGIKSPATALPLTLPWISGSPYSLYGHVRALTAQGSVRPGARRSASTCAGPPCRRR